MPNRGNDNAMASRGNGNDGQRGNPGRSGPAQARGDAPQWNDRDERRGGRVLDDGRRIFDRPDTRDWWGSSDRRGLIDGCPPGLAKKNNGCMPPGLAKARDNDYRYRYATYRPDWWGLSALGLGSGNYFYDDGYLYQMGANNSVLGYIPLLGGALSVGNAWPSYYEPVPVPAGHRYVDVAGDILLIAVGSQMVVDGINGLMR